MEKVIFFPLKRKKKVSLGNRTLYSTQYCLLWDVKCKLLGGHTQLHKFKKKKKKERQNEKIRLSPETISLGLISQVGIVRFVRSCLEKDLPLVLTHSSSMHTVYSFYFTNHVQVFWIFKAVGNILVPFLIFVTIWSLGHSCSVCVLMCTVNCWTI